MSCTYFKTYEWPFHLLMNETITYMCIKIWQESVFKRWMREGLSLAGARRLWQVVIKRLRLLFLPTWDVYYSLIEMKMWWHIPHVCNVLDKDCVVYCFIIPFFFTSKFWLVEDWWFLWIYLFWNWNRSLW